MLQKSFDFFRLLALYPSQNSYGMFPDGERLIEWHFVVHLSARKMTWGASRFKDRFDVDIKAQNRLRLFHHGCGCIDRFVSCGMLIVTDRRARITKKEDPHENQIWVRRHAYLNGRQSTFVHELAWVRNDPERIAPGANPG